MKYLFLFVVLLVSFNSVAQTEIIENDSILIWNKNRKIKWNDFKSGHRIEGYKHSDGMATISLSIGIYPKKLTCKDIDSIRVVAQMFKNKSWVGANLEKGIDHEQTHFDIAELYARKIRKKLEKILTENDECDLQAIADMYYKLEDEFWETQFLYDKEVRIKGQEEINQKKWDIKIDSLLYVYRSYERNIFIVDLKLD